MDPALTPSLIFSECHSCQCHECPDYSSVADTELVKKSEPFLRHQNSVVLLGSFMDEWKLCLDGKENN